MATHTPDTVKAQLQADIASANAATKKTDTTIHDAVQSLISGFGTGDDPILQELTVTENGEYTPPVGVDGFDSVTVNVESDGGAYTNEQIIALFDRTATEFSIPNGCSRIPTSLFESSAIITVNIPNGVTEIGSSAFRSCASLVLTNLPDTITKLGSNAFDSSKGVAITKLPDNLTNIPTYAFFRTSAKISEIPSSVTTIDNRAFFGCSLGGTVTFKGTPTSINGGAFSQSGVNTFNVPWAEGEVANAPWGATSATINYNYAEG